MEKNLEELRPKYLTEGEIIVDDGITKTVTRTLSISDEKAKEIKDLIAKQEEISAKLKAINTEIKTYMEESGYTKSWKDQGLDFSYTTSYVKHNFDTAWAKTQPWYNKHLKESNVSSSLSIKPGKELLNESIN